MTPAQEIVDKFAEEIALAIISSPLWDSTMEVSHKAVLTIQILPNMTLVQLVEENERLKNERENYEFPTLLTANQSLQSQITLANEELELLREAVHRAKELYEQMHSVYSSDLYRSVWISFANHGGDYCHGPNWVKEQEAFAKSYTNWLAKQKENK